MHLRQGQGEGPVQACKGVAQRVTLGSMEVWDPQVPVRHPAVKWCLDDRACTLLAGHGCGRSKYVVLMCVCCSCVLAPTVVSCLFLRACYHGCAMLKMCLRVLVIIPWVVLVVSIPCCCPLNFCMMPTASSDWLHHGHNLELMSNYLDLEQNRRRRPYTRQVYYSGPDNGVIVFGLSVQISVSLESFHSVAAGMGCPALARTCCISSQLRHLVSH